MKMALLVIDLQKAFRNPENERAMDIACDYINAAIPLFRKRGLPVIWVQHKDEGDGAMPGAPGFEFVDRLKPEPGDSRIVKEYGNSFNKTGLAESLGKDGVDTVLVAGYCAEHCVLSTYRGALDLDLTPIIYRNAIASESREAIDFVEKVSSVISFGALSKVLG